MPAVSVLQATFFTSVNSTLSGCEKNPGTTTFLLLIPFVNSLWVAGTVEGTDFISLAWNTSRYYDVVCQVEPKKRSLQDTVVNPCEFVVSVCF